MQRKKKQNEFVNFYRRIADWLLTKQSMSNGHDDRKIRIKNEWTHSRYEFGHRQFSISRNFDFWKSN